MNARYEITQPMPRRGALTQAITSMTTAPLWWYRCGDSSSPLASSGSSAQTLTLTGASVGKRGVMSAIDAVYFDGVTNTAQLVGSAATFLQTFTVMVLARVDSYAGNVRWLQKRTGAPFELRFGFGTGGALTMSADYNTTDLSINSQNNDVIRGRWAWYTAIFNDGSSKLMIQDNEVNSYSFYTAPVGSRVHWGSDDFRVSPTGNRFTGLLDELLVFDYPLTTDQVARIVRMSGVI